MHKYILFSTLLCAFITAQAQDLSNKDITEELPTRNQKMLDFTKQKEGKKVGNGICADFVNAAMDHATGTAFFRSKKKIDFRNDEILPGDVLYMSWKKGKRKRRIQSHVAVIVEVLAPRKVKVAHQNFNGHKFVVYSSYNLNQMVLNGRKVIIYRP